MEEKKRGVDFGSKLRPAQGLHQILFFGFKNRLKPVFHVLHITNMF